MNWRHLIEAAKLLAGQTGAPAPGRPRQAMLKRAVSTAYGAEFHALCSSNANTLTGISAGPPYPPEWTRTYRATEQRSASDRMNRHAANTSPCSAALRSNLQHSPRTPPQSRLRPRGQISPVRRGQPDWQGGNCHPSIPRRQHRRAQGARHARPAARQIIRHSPDSGNNGSCPANAPASRNDRTEPRKDRLPPLHDHPPL